MDPSDTLSPETQRKLGNHQQAHTNAVLPINRIKTFLQQSEKDIGILPKNTVLFVSHCSGLLVRQLLRNSIPPCQDGKPVKVTAKDVLETLRTHEIFADLHERVVQEVSGTRYDADEFDQPAILNPRANQRKSTGSVAPHAKRRRTNHGLSELQEHDLSSHNLQIVKETTSSEIVRQSNNIAIDDDDYD